MDRAAIVLAAILPVAALIGLGALLRRVPGLGDAFWAGAERLCYLVLLPALLAVGLATADLSAVPVAAMAGAIVLSLVVVGAGLVAAKPAMRVDGPTFTSVFQGGVRFNNYIALAVAAGLHGAPGVTLAAVATAAIVPTVNVMSVLVFARFGTARPTVLGTAKALATNPLILACAIGGAIQLIGVPLPGFVVSAGRSLGQASLPIGLLCVGAAFQPAALWAKPRAAAISSVAKFVILPLAVWLACRGFGVGGAAAEIALLFASMPTASSSYILARQLGGDAPLMAGITTAQTIVSAATIPIALALGG
ncbi:AEC family transporter [Elioraea rosea]|uniref:AEC family transporter n=1 Tax=Elioraea rosea TaxID=2492390 RepID=UPI0011836885|nr:AEC family transporter [Elioraea rosea]